MLSVNSIGPQGMQRLAKVICGIRVHVRAERQHYFLIYLYLKHNVL